MLLEFCLLLSLPVPSDELVLALHANLREKPAWLRFVGDGIRTVGEEVVISGDVREREAMAWLSSFWCEID